MNEQELYIVIATGIVIGGCVATVLWYGLPHLSGVKIQRGFNNPGTVTAMFLKLVNVAERHIVIYDDGNNMPDSIYREPEVVAALGAKLESNPDLRVVCIFNDNGEEDRSMPFRRTFEDHQRVTMIANDQHRPTVDTHYKIIDGGRMAYVSTHRQGEDERKFGFYDFTGVDEDLVRSNVRRLLRKYLRDLERKRQLHSAIPQLQAA